MQKRHSMITKRNLSGQDWAGISTHPALLERVITILVVVVLAGMLTGCENDDCINCIELPPPVVPTGVFSVSGDDLVTVHWTDISYSPYDGRYNENVVSYRVYSRYFADGDQDDQSRVFDLIGEVAWDDPNYDSYSGLHTFFDDLAENGERYEYAIASVNSAGRESALSYELVTDAPLEISPAPIELFDSLGSGVVVSGFDFSEQDILDPNTIATNADIKIEFDRGIAFVRAVDSSVRLQDYGVYSLVDGILAFSGVDWAPADGYSATGYMELIEGHIYIVEIYDSAAETLNYAKFGVVEVKEQSVRIMWAYQTIAGLPELKAPVEQPVVDRQPVAMSF